MIEMTENVYIQINTNIQETKQTMEKELVQSAINIGNKMGSLMATGLKNSLKLGLANVDTDSLSSLKNGFSTLFSQMANGQDVSGTLEGIKESSTTFMTSLMTTLKNIGTQLPTIINVLAPAFAELINTFIPIAIPLLVDCFTAIFGALADNLPLIVQTLVAQIPAIMQAFIDGFMSADLGGKIGLLIIGGLTAFNLAQKIMPIIQPVLDIFKTIKLPSLGGGAEAAGGGGISGFLSGLSKGLLAFSNPKVLLGATLLGATMVILSGAAWASIQIIADALPKLGISLQSFNGINGVNLLAVGAGLTALAVGLIALTGASILDGLAGLIGLDFGSALQKIIEPIATLMPTIALEDIAKFALLGNGLLALGLGFNMVKGFTSGKTIAESITAIHGAVLAVFLTGGIEMYQGVSNNLIALSAGLIKLSTIVLNPSNIVAFLTNVSNKIRTLNNFDWETAVLNMKTKGATIGKAVAQGIQSGVNNNAFLFIDSIKQKVQEMIDEAKRKAGISSPSKVFENEVGYWIGAGTGIGVKKGINDYMPNSINTIKAGLSGYELDSNSSHIVFPNELKIIDGDGIMMRVKPVIDEKIVRNNINKGLVTG